MSLLNKPFNDISDITVFFKRILTILHLFKRKITRKLVKYNLHVYRYACSHDITTLIYILSRIISIFQEVKLIYMKTSPYKHYSQHTVFEHRTAKIVMIYRLVKESQVSQCLTYRKRGIYMYPSLADIIWNTIC